ncbi:hypothetical protein C8F04DRAFT_711263 [Mycena alexandri]|uniref:Uncharacterized protein n=1 Tax=Mycena alexandri TaxID=1745969 RepID=A0AAD6SR84_9AGAR|nr:hypothetical protein C8F04DRAFT_711263 [Mycena alexandri]
MRSTKSWCLAVTRHPHLAQRVHALSLTIPETVKLQPADGTKIQRALTLCVNLKELKVTFEKSSNDSGPHSIHGWLINECPFRLTKFTNLYFNSAWISQFWKAQSELRVLSVPTLWILEVLRRRAPQSGCRQSSRCAKLASWAGTATRRGVFLVSPRLYSARTIFTHLDDFESRARMGGRSS